ncbi:MAG: glutamate 5-kinase [Nevskiales bacterium]
MEKTPLHKAQRWVVKIGSSLLTNAGRGLDHAMMDTWVSQIASLRAQGREVVLVSSGAVAEGMSRLGWRQRPKTMHELQAAAAVGQMGLVQAYESRFQKHGLRTAQVLFTHEDVSDRRRYLNASSTLRALLALKVVPVVNENDTVATDEIRLGDNDTLGALTVNLTEADVLVILTDQQGLYDADPRANPVARLIATGQAGDPALLAMAGVIAGDLGRGGMRTKLSAAEQAAHSGAATVIAHGREPEILPRLAQGEAIGTLLLPGEQKLASRKRWIAGQLQVRGRLYLDAGAARVLLEAGKSLLPVGVQRVEGHFQRGDLVGCMDPEGREIARGLVNYAADEAERITGRASAEIGEILGYAAEPELIHRDNLILL